MKCNAWVAGRDFESSLSVASKSLFCWLVTRWFCEINPDDLGNVLFCMPVVSPKMIGQIEMRDHSPTNVSESFMKDLELRVVPKCLISTSNATAVVNINRVACETNVDPVEALCRSR